MASSPDPAALAAIHRFLVAYSEDRDAGLCRPLSEYQARCPGFEVEIALQFEQLQVAMDLPPPGAEDETTGTDAEDRYRILRELGRGGQGVVYLAEDQRLHRRVALKVLQRTLDPDGAVMARFRREAEAASRLDHPGICAVHDVGEYRGLPFIALQYVEGETLGAKIASAREEDGAPVLHLAGSEVQGTADPSGTASSHASSSRRPVQQVLRLLERVAEAVHAAHEAGVIHRDLKPANIMVRQDGSPVVLDFGLARDLDSDLPSITRSGDLFGSPAYMAPEQIQAERGRPDRRTDVYALGVTLHECLTLRRPFEEPTREGLYRAILTKTPPDPCALNPAVPADLRVVLETALWKDPARRYGTAQDLAEDLRRVRQREPILARPPGRWLRLQRWAQRNPALAASSGGTVALLVLALVLSLWFIGRLRDSLRAADALVLASASLEAQEEDARWALQIAREAFRMDPSPATESRLRSALGAMHERVRIPDAGNPVSCLAFLPDGRLVSGSGDGTVHIWSAEGEELARMVHPGERDRTIRDVVWSADGRRILSVCNNKSVILWSDQGEKLKELPHTGVPWNADVAPDGSFLTVCLNGELRLWTRDGDPIQVLQAHQKRIWDGCFSPDGSRIVTASHDGTARIWHRTMGVWDEEPVILRGHEAQVWSARFSPDGERVLTVSSNGGYGTIGPADRTARVWNLQGECLAVFPHRFALLAGCISPDGRFVLTAANGSVTLWALDEAGAWDPVRDLKLVTDDPRTFFWGGFTPAGDRILVVGGAGYAKVFALDGREVATLAGHTNLVLTGAVAPEGRRYATGGSDRSIIVWGEADAGNTLLHEPAGQLYGVTPLPQGGFATASDDRVALWTEAGELLRSLPAGESDHGFMSVAASRDGRQVLATTNQGGWTLWSVDGSILKQGKVSGGSPTSISCAFDPQGRFLMVSGRTTVHLYPVGEGDPVDLKGHKEIIKSVVFSPSGDQILSASWDGTARVWDRLGIQQAQFPHPRRVRHATFLPEGRRLLTACEDRCVYLWDLDDPRRDADGLRIPVHRYTGHNEAVVTVAYDPVTDLVASGSADGTVRAWTLAGDPQWTLQGHRGAVLTVQFLPDRGLLLTSSWAGNVRTWPVSLQAVMERVDAALGGPVLAPADQARVEELLVR